MASGGGGKDSNTDDIPNAPPHPSLTWDDEAQVIGVEGLTLQVIGKDDGFCAELRRDFGQGQNGAVTVPAGDHDRLPDVIARMGRVDSAGPVKQAPEQRPFEQRRMAAMLRGQQHSGARYSSDIPRHSQRGNAGSPLYDDAGGVRRSVRGLLNEQLRGS